MTNKYDVVMERVRCWYVQDELPVVTEETLREFEREIGHRLPADYRHFLPKYGFSAGKAYTCYGELDAPGDVPWENRVGPFYGLGPSPNYSILENLRSHRESGLPERLLPIASTDSGPICLSLAGPDAGRVYLWPQPDLDLDEEILLAYDFDTFIRSLRRVEREEPGK